MNNVMNAPTDASSAAADARHARVEELQRRRAAGTVRVQAEQESSPLSGPSVEPARQVRAARAGAAQGSKIAAAGFGLAAMLGLVAAMGFASATSAPAPPATPETVPPAEVVVVIHPADGTAGASTVAGSPGVVTTTPTRPIVLSARPTVHQAPPSQAPAGQTNGSR